MSRYDDDYSRHVTLADIENKLEEIRLRRGLSGEGIEEMKSISRSLEKIEQLLLAINNSASGGLGISLVAILLGLILWRVW
jgi:hypothetical protein